MAVDLQADVLAGGAEVVEEDGVLLGCQHVAGDGVRRRRAAHRRCGTARSPPTSAAMRCDGWSALAGTCTASWPPGASAAPPAGDHADVVGHPLQAGVGEHEVVVAVRRPGRQVAVLEAQPRPGVLRGGGQHRRRRVDADHVADVEPLGERGGQLTRCRSRGRRRAGSGDPARSARRGPRTAGPARRRTCRTARGPSRHPGSS